VLAEFKKMISEAGLQLSPEFVVYGDLNATLHRFLRARKYKLEAAFAMLESELLVAWGRAAWERVQEPAPPLFWGRGHHSRRAAARRDGRKRSVRYAYNFLLLLPQPQPRRGTEQPAGASLWF
jgi:hypothetical protein